MAADPVNLAAEHTLFEQNQAAVSSVPDMCNTLRKLCRRQCCCAMICQQQGLSSQLRWTAAKGVLMLRMQALLCSRFFTSLSACCWVLATNTNTTTITMCVVSAHTW